MLYSIIYLSLILAPASNMGQMKMNLEVKGEDYSIYAKTKIVELKNLRASEIEPFVRARLSQYGAVQINDALNMLIITDREPKLTDLVNLVKELDKKKIKNFLRLETAVLPLKNVLPSSVVDVIKERLSPDGFVQANNDLNVLVITDVSTKIEEAKRILSLIDISPKQVMVEGQVIEMDDNYARSLGLDIFGIVKNLHPSAGIRKSKGSREDFYNYTDGDTTSQLRKDNYNSLEIHGSISLSPGFFDLIKQGLAKGKIKKIQSIRLNVLNNRKGIITLAGDFSINEREGFTRSGDSRWSYTSEYRSINRSVTHNAISLSIVPRIGNAGDIVMDVLLAAPAHRAGEGYFSTTIKVKDGETITLGGMKIDIVDTEDNGIPLLKSIPILGYFFKREVKTHTIKDIAVIITPHIVK